MTNNSLIDELDALFGKSARPARPAQKRASTPAPAGEIPKSSSPRYWLPEATVLYTASWRCTCGETGTCAPALMLRERSGRQTRLRAISRAAHYASLPREIERGEPSLIHDCPECFVTSDPFGPEQLSLPLGSVEPLAEFVQAVETGLEHGFLAEFACRPENFAEVKNDPILSDIRMRYIAGSGRGAI